MLPRIPDNFPRVFSLFSFYICHYFVLRHGRFMTFSLEFLWVYFFFIYCGLCFHYVVVVVVLAGEDTTKKPTTETTTNRPTPSNVVNQVSKLRPQSILPTNWVQIWQRRFVVDLDFFLQSTAYPSIALPSTPTTTTSKSTTITNESS